MWFVDYLLDGEIAGVLRRRDSDKGNIEPTVAKLRQKGPTVSLGEGELHLGVAASKCGSDARNEGSLCILGKTNPKRCRVHRGDSAGFHDHHVQLSKQVLGIVQNRPTCIGQRHPLPVTLE